MDDRTRQPASGPLAADQSADTNLFSPLTIRGVTLRNRIVMSPMCQYSCHDGFATDWHLVHLGSRATGGAALIIAEATAVTPQGRISADDLGIWSDDHIAPLARIVNYIESQGAVPGIQLAHAGRKGARRTPWNGSGPLAAENGAWPLVAPSAISFDNVSQTPDALDTTGIDAIVEAFEAGAKRALAAGFKVIEIHGAHGYLLHEFLSPLSNARDDDYGGSLENRMRLILRVAARLRDIIPDHLPLFVRISATDWVDGGWDLDQSVVLAGRLKALGVDLVDCSSAGASPAQAIKLGKGYQVPFATRIRADAGIMTGAIGMITEPHHANDIITGGDADLVFLGRELLRDPYWPQHAALALGATPSWPNQYGYAVKPVGR